MNTPHQIAPAIVAANFSLPVRKKSFSAWMMSGLLLLTLCAARADVPDDDYLAIYGIMNQADALDADGKISQAHAKYIKAYQALEEFRRSHPDWNVNIVSYRLNYLAEKAAATSEHPAGSDTGTIVVKKTPAAAEGSATPPANTVAPESTDPTSVIKETASAAKSPVKLLDAGSEPRTVLRLHPTTGDKQIMTMTMQVGMDMSTAGKPTPAMSIPAIVMNMDVAVTSISTNGDITYAMVFNDATITADTNTLPAIAAAMKAGLGDISGMTGTGEMSDGGIVKKVEIKLPATAAPQLRQTIGQMKESFNSSATPLPEAAVGPGARWEYQTRIKSQGMSIDQTLTCELVSIEGDRLNLRTTITQNAANQKIQNPAVPTLQMDLTKMTGNGTGTTTLDLGKLMPVSAMLAEKTEVVMAMNVRQQKQTMDMKMNMNVVIESK
jgi:hypothetical protein